MALQLVSFAFPLFFFHSVPLLGHSRFIDVFRVLDRYLIPYFIGFHDVGVDRAFRRHRTFPF